MNDNYLNDSGFLLLFFEIFVDLLLIIGVITEKIRAVKIILNYFQNRYQLYENYMKMIWY